MHLYSHFILKESQKTLDFHTRKEGFLAPNLEHPAAEAGSTPGVRPSSSN